MKPDLRYLLFLNAALLVISCVALFRLLALAPPKTGFSGTVESRRISLEEPITPNQVGVPIFNVGSHEARTKERRATALLIGFAGVVGATNFYFMLVLYRQVRKGIYFHDGVELERN